MGTLRFSVPANDIVDWPELACATLGDSGGHREASPLITGEGELCFERSGDQSARLFVAAPVNEAGRPILGTGTLRPREEPYDAIMELARGRLAGIRELTAHCEQAGIPIPSEVASAVEAAQLQFCQATCAHDGRGQHVATTRAVLQATLAASERLIDAVVGRHLAEQHLASGHLPILLSCPLKGLTPGGSWEDPFRRVFSAAKVAAEWSLIESRQGEYDWTLPDEQVAFAEENHLLAIGGPLIDFRPGRLPGWLTAWSEDYWSFQSIVSDFVETALQRYEGRIRCWELAAATNVGRPEGPDEEFRLAMTAKAIDVARQADDQVQLSLRISQPWGEYQRHGRDRLSPRQFAETLMRTGAGLTSITLEIAFGYGADGSGYRDRFALSRLIDWWSALGVPLTMSLAFPSAGGRDELADPGIRSVLGIGERQVGEAAQDRWLGEVLPLLMTKKSVAGVEWAHFSDAVSHRFPHAGLTRGDDSGKMILDRLIGLREAYSREAIDAAEREANP